MSYLKYNLPGLWFQIYREVLSLNENLGDLQMNQNQLREVATSIFISSTQRGIVRPYTYTKFQANLLEMTKSVFKEGQKETVLKAVKRVLNGSPKRTEVIDDGGNSRQG